MIPGSMAALRRGPLILDVHRCMVGRLGRGGRYEGDVGNLRQLELREGRGLQVWLLGLWFSEVLEEERRLPLPFGL